MNTLNFNIFNILIISGVIQGFIFSLIVLTQKKHIKNNVLFLGLTVLFLSLSNLQYWFFDTNLANKFSIIKYIFIPWQWLILPTFYLYVYRFIGLKKLSKKTLLLLFLPFTLVLLTHICHVLFNKSSNINEVVSHFKRGLYVYIELLSFIFNVIIMLFILKMIINHENDKSYNYNWVKSETNWLKKLIYIGLTICFLWLIALLIVIIFNINKSYLFYPLWLVISGSIYFIGYVGVNKSQQLKKRIELRKKRISSFKSKPTIVKEKKKITNGFSKIETYIKINKSYLNAQLSLTIIAEKLNLSEGYISQLINKNTSLNFNDYINALRIDDAKSMLNNSEYNNYTIQAIGLEAGFNSKSSFYMAFKKFTGKTPVTYKKSVQNL